MLDMHEKKNYICRENTAKFLLGMGIGFTIIFVITTFFAKGNPDTISKYLSGDTDLMTLFGELEGLYSKGVSGGITINPYIPNPDYANYSFSIDNGLKISGDDWFARYSVYFVMKTGAVYNWSSIPSSIGKAPWVIDAGTTDSWIRKKYGFNFTSISTTIKNNLNYVVLHLEEYENLTIDDVRRDGNTIVVKDKVFISHDDLLENYTIPIINRTDVVIGNLAPNFIANLDGT